MRISIKKHSSTLEQYNWYKDKIGTEYEVVDITKLSPKVREYVVLENNEQKKILATDCKIFWDLPNE